MKYVLIFLIVALVIKDITLINEPYLLRATSQGVCLVVGGFSLLYYLNLSLLKRYWAVFGYMLSILLTVLVSSEPIYVLLQVISLSAVIIFFIVYYESRAIREEKSNECLIVTTIISYSLLCILSLVAIIFYHEYAYEYLSRTEIRFRGIYSKSGMTSSAAGILIVLVLFGMRRSWRIYVPLICGVACMALTLSRTAWVGCFLSICFTMWLYYPYRRKFVAAVVGLSAFVVTCMYVLNIRMDSETVANVENVLRVNSISTFNGRTKIWRDGFAAFSNSPFLGHGFTLGAEALQKNTTTESLHTSISQFHQESFFSLDKSRDIGKSTLHNGILQSLLDAGIIGTFFYVSAMVTALRGFFCNDIQKKYPAEYACILFLLITNLAQNVIYSASIFDSILFWGLAVFALSLRNRKNFQVNSSEKHMVIDGYAV